MSVPFLTDEVGMPHAVRPRTQRAAREGARIDRSLVLAMGLAAVVAALATYWAYRNDLILTYYDAQSHLNIARRVLDSRTPGLAQLGTVWLPFPHLLMLPLVANDFLWRSGLAGSVVGLLSFVGTVGALFLTVRRLTGRESAAWVALAALTPNPNILYLHTTALTEPVLLVTMTSSAYFLLRWGQDRANGDLMLAGLLAALAVGSRYDGWFFALACGGIVALVAWWRSRRYAVVESLALTFLAAPLYAMIGWFGYNWIIFGNPLEFQGGRYSAQFQQNAIAQSEGLATKHNLTLSALSYGWAVIDNTGWIVLALGVAGLLAYAAKTRFRPEAAIPYAFLAALPFNILALWLGQTIIRVPQLPQGNVLSSFNIRYGALLLPGMALFVGWLYATLADRLRLGLVLPAFALLLALQGGLWLADDVRSSAVMADGLDFQRAFPEREQVAVFLRREYDGGGILIDDSQNHVILRAGIDMREYIATFSGPFWRAALAEPEHLARWVVLDMANREDQVATALSGQDSFRQHYALAYTSGTLAVYRQIDTTSEVP